MEHAGQGAGAALMWPWTTNGRKQQTAWPIGALMLTSSSPSCNQETPLALSSCLEDSEYLLWPENARQQVIGTEHNHLHGGCMCIACATWLSTDLLNHPRISGRRQPRRGIMPLAQMVPL